MAYKVVRGNATRALSFVADAPVYAHLLLANGACEEIGYVAAGVGGGLTPEARVARAAHTLTPDPRIIPIDAGCGGLGVPHLRVGSGVEEARLAGRMLGGWRKGYDTVVVVSLAEPGKGGAELIEGLVEGLLEARAEPVIDASPEALEALSSLASRGRRLYGVTLVTLEDVAGEYAGRLEGGLGGVALVSVDASGVARSLGVDTLRQRLGVATALLAALLRGRASISDIISRLGVV